MVVRPRNQSNVWAKRMEVTQPGVAALRRALRIAVDVQQCLLGVAQKVPFPGNTGNR